MISQLRELERTPEFKEWKEAHEGAYLSSIFLLREKSDFKVAFFDPDSDKITTFELNPFRILPEDDAVGGNKVKALDVSKVKISFDRAMKIADDERVNKVGREGVQQSIVILQNLNAQLYNVTFVTSAFNILNVKVDASSGEIIKSDLSNLMGSTKIL